MSTSRSALAGGLLLAAMLLSGADCGGRNARREDGACDADCAAPADAGGESTDAGSFDGGSAGADVGTFDGGAADAGTCAACDPHADCTATDAGAVCACEPGWTGDGFSCRCASDVGCAAGESCQDGRCQPVPGCRTDGDCAPGLHCDPGSGHCLAKGTCTTDSGCAAGQVCDPASFHCVAGCRDGGACPSGEVCRCADGTDTCALRQCAAGPCSDSADCPYGQSCETPPAGGPGTCVLDTRGPFCTPCAIAPGQSSCPGAAPNFCLEEPSRYFTADYCGVDCSDPANAECPSGFECADVLIPTETPCSATTACPLDPRLPCHSDADCPGGRCDTAAGQCRASCVIGSGDGQGFCGCLHGADCPTDRCGSDGRCVVSLRACDAATPCAPIGCEPPAAPRTAGLCRIGRNCMLAAGVTCDEVRAARP